MIFVFGEPRRFHPLVGFGICADKLEQFFNQYQSDVFLGKASGFVAFILLVLPIVLVFDLLASLWPGSWRWLLDALVIALAIGYKSLIEHSMEVVKPLLLGDLDSARSAVSMIVSRDTTHLNQNEISVATIESILENGSDAIFAVIFWYLLAGLPGVVLYRLTNTLDAMWGYRTPQHLQFGWFAARFDDILNLIPARLTALAYAITGHFKLAMACWRTQGRRWYSVNAGPVMAAGAGALEVLLGGNTVYHGEMKIRPVLGCENPARVEDIQRALNLVAKSILLWLAIIALIELVV